MVVFADLMLAPQLPLANVAKRQTLLPRLVRGLLVQIVVDACLVKQIRRLP
jgi:hypothetical protein